MSLSQSSVTESGAAPGALAHIPARAETCPTCDQPIPLDRFDEIKERIDTRQAAHTAQVAARLQEQFKREMAEALEQAGRDAAANLAMSVGNARAEERLAADKAASLKLADAERESKEAQSALQVKIDQAEAAKVAAEQSENALRAQLDQARLDYEAAITNVKQEAEANAVVIRAEAERKAEAAVQEKIAAMERTRQQSEAALQERIYQAEAARTAAENSGIALRAALDQARVDHEAAITSVQQEAEANAVAIRADAAREAEAAVQENIAGMERMRQESEAALQARIHQAEAAKAAAENSGIALRAELDQARVDHEAAITSVKQEAEADAVRIRAQAIKEVEATAYEKITNAERAKADAEAKVVSFEQQIQTLKTTHETDVVQRLAEQREILEKAQVDAVNAEKSASFQKELKLQEKVDQLQRSLDNKTAEELGEGAEIDLFELLKGEFENDKVERINRGQPGADILHTVVHNGKECGRIIYDSKNHNAWRNEFVAKLAADQMGARAEHAVLSTRKFPAGKRHLHVQDGVVLAAPSRVLALVQILRQHIVQTHTLRCSNEARAQKTALLYAFINSERGRDLFSRIDAQAEKLLELQVKEKRAHEDIWKRQGELIRSVQKVQAEIVNEIDTIIGTAETLEKAIYE